MVHVCERTFSPGVLVSSLHKGPSLYILRKDIGVGGPEYGNFPLIYVLVKMTLRKYLGGWVVQKKPQNTLT